MAGIRSDRGPARSTMPLDRPLRDLAIALMPE
jgi:hypothetical protein